VNEEVNSNSQASGVRVLQPYKQHAARLISSCFTGTLRTSRLAAMDEQAQEMAYSNNRLTGTGREAMRFPKKLLTLVIRLLD